VRGSDTGRMLLANAASRRSNSFTSFGNVLEF
jgi:hypothetical protein